MECGGCGKVLLKGEQFCSQCGRVAPQEQAAASENYTDFISQFVGKNADYYTNKWQSPNNTWNWASFFLTIWWLGYRRMYGTIAVIIGIWLGIDLFTYVVEANGGGTFDENGFIVSIASSVFLGIMGNRIYRTRAEKYAQEPRKGGTSWGGVGIAFVCSAAYLLVTVLLYDQVVQSKVDAQIIFGKEEKGGFVQLQTDTFNFEDTIHYEFYFPNKGGDYKVMLEKWDGDNWSLYDSWGNSVPPDWTGVIETMQVPYESGSYTLKIVMKEEVIAAGEFVMTEK